MSQQRHNTTEFIRKQFPTFTFLGEGGNGVAFLLPSLSFVWKYSKTFGLSNEEIEYLKSIHLQQPTQSSSIKTKKDIKYVIKYYKTEMEPTEIQEIKKEFKKVNNYFNAKCKSYFIFPFYIGTSRLYDPNTKKRWNLVYDLQIYGGMELYTVFYDEKMSVSSFDIFRTIFYSCIRIMECCVELIQKEKLLITDIKEENMVIERQTGKICLIDLEFYCLDEWNTIPIITSYPDLLPVQFFHILRLNKNKDYLVQHNLNRYFENFDNLEQKKKQQKRWQQFKNTKKAYNKQLLAMFSIYWPMFHLLEKILINILPDKPFLLCVFRESFLTPLKTKRIECIKNGNDVLLLQKLRIYVSLMKVFFI